MGAWLPGVSRVGGRTVRVPVNACVGLVSARGLSGGVSTSGTVCLGPSPSSSSVACQALLAVSLSARPSSLYMVGRMQDKAGRQRFQGSQKHQDLPPPFSDRDLGSAPGALGSLTEIQERPLALQTRDAHTFMSHSKLHKKTWTYSPSHWLGHTHSQSLDSLTHSG